MIQWIFLDVGNVLFNDDPQSFAAYDHYFEAIRQEERDFTFREMLRCREEIAIHGRPWVLHDITSRYLDEDRIEEVHRTLCSGLLSTYDANHLPVPQLEATLEELHGRYRLGILANQPPECRRSLERRGLLRYFDVVAISEECGLFKPDTRFYEWAVREAGTVPAACVMIGDRIDNDILPAQAIGMQTVWVRRPPAEQRNWHPTDPRARLFLASLDRVPIFGLEPPGHEEADKVISELEELPTCLANLEGEASLSG